MLENGIIILLKPSFRKRKSGEGIGQGSGQKLSVPGRLGLEEGRRCGMKVEIGEKIRELRRRDDRTQEDLARALGVTCQAEIGRAHV